MLHGRYLINNRLQRLGVNVIDAVLDRLMPKSGAAPPSHPKRVLLALGGHLGDAIIATSAIGVTRDLLPDAEIGVLAASWSRVAIDGNSDVTRVHVVDHWKISRKAGTFRDKLLRYAATWRQAQREIRGAKYDLAIDLYPYYPNSAALLKSAGVPARVGYTSAGLGAFYTHPVHFADEPVHQAEQHARLIARALGRPLSPKAPRYRLRPVSDESRERVATRVSSAGISPRGYVLAHMSAATPQRSWTTDKWRSTLERIIAEGHQVVCTGLAGREAAIAAEAGAGLQGCVNLSGELSWDDLVAAVAAAKLVLSVDTAVAHVAAAFDVPTVTLMATIARPEHWRPYTTAGTALSNPVPCAPCFDRMGCAHMSCIRGIGVEEVLEAVRVRLAGSP